MSGVTFVTLGGDVGRLDFKTAYIYRNVFLGLTSVLLVSAAVFTEWSFADQRYLSLQLLLLAMTFFCYYEYRDAENDLSDLVNNGGK